MTLIISLALLPGAVLLAQPTGDTGAAEPLPAKKAQTQTAAAPPKDPYDAFAAGYFDRALQGFLDEQVDHPNEPRLELSIGSANYKMRDYEAAQAAYQRAAGASDPLLRARAVYNLGNTAYRQGQLGEAVDLYMAALEQNPDDPDAKYNLEFVREEIKRRQEEAKKREQQSPQQKQQQQEQQEQQEQQQQPSQDQQDPSEQQEQQQSQQPKGPDRDRDGLPDQVEQSGENPTDPENPDSDRDGLRDGEEDRNQNGRVDPAETDPNRPDSDGDGTPDAEEAGASRGAQAQSAQAMQASPEGLSQEQANRYLQALEEGRPERAPKTRGRRASSGKDW